MDAAKGENGAAGLAADVAWRTLQFAADHVEPGDTVQVYPGIYFEHVKMQRAGEKTKPIVFRAAKGGPVIITGAWPKVRRAELKWTLEDSSLGLYSIPCQAEPATLLAGDANLYRYPTLAELRAFWVENVVLSGKRAPGPRHGFAWDSGKLYVRLHAAGRYGPTDPNQQTMKVSPPRGSGKRGDEIDSRERFCWGVVTDAPAFVTLEGFHFESPGYCGVWVRHGGVTVRDCTFRGCRTGVRGWDRSENKPRNLSDDVIVEHCDFSEFPCYNDVQEVVALAEKLPDEQRSSLPPFFWWHRKGGPYSCEIGLVTAAGRRWVIRDNHIDQVFDGLSFMSLSWCEDTEVAGNTFHHVIDNAIEAENHAQRLHVHDNVVHDTFEPFSYQPLGGEPWPSDIRLENNRVSLSAEAALFWSKPILKWTHGCFKIRVAKGFTAVPQGLVARGNLLYFPGGNALSLSLDAVAIEGVRFERNVFIGLGLGGTDKGIPPQQFVFEKNLIAPGAAKLDTAGAEAWTAHGGKVFASADEIGLKLGPDGNLTVIPGSAAAAVSHSR